MPYCLVNMNWKRDREREREIQREGEREGETESDGNKERERGREGERWGSDRDICQIKISCISKIKLTIIINCFNMTCTRPCYR